MKRYTITPKGIAVVQLFELMCKLRGLDHSGDDWSEDVCHAFELAERVTDELFPSGEVAA